MVCLNFAIVVIGRALSILSLLEALEGESLFLCLINFAKELIYFLPAVDVQNVSWSGFRPCRGGSQTPSQSGGGALPRLLDVDKYKSSFIGYQAGLIFVAPRCMREHPNDAANLTQFIVSPRFLMIKISLHRQAGPDPPARCAPRHDRRPLQMFWTIVIPSACLMLLSSYAIRIFEGPARARHSLYFWDQMWMVARPTSRSFCARPFRFRLRVRVNFKLTYHLVYPQATPQ